MLHTWGQNLHFHPHIHLIMTAGGMTGPGQWQAMPEGYCLPVWALSAIFRAKCFAALERLGQDLPAVRLPKEWVVHARKPQADPGSLLLYLGRYVYRVAIDETRIQSVDTDSVTFRYKDNYQRVPKNKNKSESPAKEAPSIALSSPYCHRMSDLPLRGHPEMLTQKHACPNNPLTP